MDFLDRCFCHVGAIGLDEGGLLEDELGALLDGVDSGSWEMRSSWNRSFSPSKNYEKPYALLLKENVRRKGKDHLYVIDFWVRKDLYGMTLER